MVAFEARPQLRGRASNATIPVVLYVVADTCEKSKLISSYVKNCTIHDTEFRFK